MWCSSCHQDVPGVVQPITGRLICARCQHVLRAAQPTHAVQICDEGIPLDELAGRPADTEPPRRRDGWQTARRARQLGRELRRPGIGGRTDLAIELAQPRRFDPPQSLFDELAHATSPGTAPLPVVVTPHANPLPKRSAGGQIAAWLVVVLGAAALAAGLGTIGWSLYAGRTDVWNLALGLTLGGQGTLIFGLVLVVSRLWRNSRYATGKLQSVHAQLGQLQRTADALAAMRGGGAPAFYAELARGASPQLLLANLKGQIDQLSSRLGSR